MTASTAPTTASAASAPSASTAPQKDTQSRKYLLTINNPQDKGLTHDALKLTLSTMKSVIYWVMSDEMGGETATYHTHVFFACKAPMRFSTVKNRFPDAHIDTAYGSSQENHDYVLKEGKHAKSEKGATKVSGTQEEWGEMPDDTKAGRSALYAALYEMVSAGLTNFEIIDKNPDYVPMVDKIDRLRLTIYQEKYKEEWRNLEVTYISGPTGLGKTRGIMEGFGYSNVFRVTDYDHPFDTYGIEEVIMFEEFSSSIRIQDMLNYLDGYPCKLPARYSDKQACYTKVFITSNLSLSKQYPNVQKENPEVWEAFLRRINKVRIYTNANVCKELDSVDDYLHGFHPVTSGDKVPFPDEPTPKKEPDPKPDPKPDATCQQERLNLENDGFLSVDDKALPWE